MNATRNSNKENNLGCLIAVALLIRSTTSWKTTINTLAWRSSIACLSFPKMKQMNQRKRNSYSKIWICTINLGLLIRKNIISWKWTNKIGMRLIRKYRKPNPMEILILALKAHLRSTRICLVHPTLSIILNLSFREAEPTSLNLINRWKMTPLILTTWLLKTRNIISKMDPTTISQMT